MGVLYGSGEKVLECPKTLKSERKKNLYDSKISLAEIFFLLKATHVLHHPGRTDFNAL